MILELIKKKADQLGTEEVLKVLGVNIKTYSAYFYKGNRFKGPTDEVKANVLDAWGDEGEPATDEPEPPMVKEAALSEVIAVETSILSVNHDTVPLFRETDDAISLSRETRIVEKPSESSASQDGDAVNVSIVQKQLPGDFAAKDVCLCIPTYGDIPSQYLTCIVGIIMKYRDQLRWESRSDDSMIARSRNQIAKRFLNGGASWSIWLDSDMVVPFGNGGVFGQLTGMLDRVPRKFLDLHTVDRLLSWKRSIVGGCYWDRRGSGKLIAGGGQPILQNIPSDGLHAVSFVGTGCLAVHRQVFLDIAAKFPETMSPDSLGNECGFFTPIQTEHRMLGEDESFAKRATEAGHPSFLDLGLICGHVGTSVKGIPESGSKI